MVVGGVSGEGVVGVVRECWWEAKERLIAD